MNKWMQKALEQLTQSPAHVNETQKSEHEQQPADYDQGWKDGYKHGAWASEQQPADEPVAWGMPGKDGFIFDVICPEEHDREEGGYTVPLYTRPQPAAWVGLTPEERNSIWKADQMTHKEWDALFDTVELKLKEKNGGGV